MEALFVGEACEVVGCGGVFGIDAADSVKDLWIAFEHAGQIAVVVLVVADLDDDRAGDVVGMHQVQELLDGVVFGGWGGSGGEGEGGVVLEDMDVGVDQSGSCRRSCRRFTAGCDWQRDGRGEEASAIHVRDFILRELLVIWELVAVGLVGLNFAASSGVDSASEALVALATSTPKR